VRTSRILATAFLLLALVAAVAPADLRVPPAPDRRISDYAGALTPAQRDRLEQQLVEREQGSGNQVVVAIFRSLDGESLEDFSIRLAQAWRIGQKGLDNGVIFLVFLDDRKMRIEVGYGLEPTLTDAVSSSILRDVVAPRFREGKVAEGIGAGLDAIEAAIKGTYRAPAARRAPPSGSLSFAQLLLLLVVLGGIGVAVVPSLFFDRGARRNGWTGHGTGWGGPFMGGGGFGGGGGSSSSSGGFSGGGGSFGGGGASGSW
jgi:uncharacterized protein